MLLGLVLALSWFGGSEHRSSALNGIASAMVDPFVNDSTIHSDDFQSVEAHRLSEFWKDTAIPPQYIQAACGGCHQSVEVRGAPLLTRGRQLIREKGCVGCHDLGEIFESIERGPNLDDIGNKTHRGWVYNWLKDPSIYLADPGMPSFRLDERDVLFLIEFLMSLNTKTSPPNPIVGLPSEDGDPDRGNVLIRESRCITCHSIHERGGDFAPELELVSDKVREEWLANFLRNVHYYQPEKKMLAFNFTNQDALDIAAYILEEYSEDDFEFPPDSIVNKFIPFDMTTQEKVKKGKQTFLRYGCRGCHTVAEIPSLKIGPDLSRIGERHEEEFFFGEVDDAAKNLANWIFMKVTDPNAFVEMHSMPDFRFSDEEALAITIALLANDSSEYRDDWIVHELKPKRYALPDNEFGKLVEKYSCLSCHQIEGYGGDISTVPLTFEGSKVRYEWLKEYLIRPHAVRPTLTERMPLFRMTESEAIKIANYIKTVFVSENIPVLREESFSLSERSAGENLFNEKKCVSCHILNGAGGYVGPQLENVGNRLEPGWIFAWLKEPNTYRPGTAQPDYGFSDQEARALTAYLVTLKGSAEHRSGK